VFGPTYAGDALKFPGLLFSFEEDGMVEGTLGKKNEERDRQQEVKRIIITPRPAEDGSEQDPLEEVVECPAMYGDLRRALVVPGNGVILYFYTQVQPPPVPIRIKIGLTTAEDLTCDLGPPLRVHYKEDDRMTIHSTRTDSDGADEGYFYNYLQHGVDFLISGTTHRVQKIILHSNVAGSHLFQRYKRCPWEIINAEDVDFNSDDVAESPTVSVGDKIDTVKGFLSVAHGNTPPSMLLDRAADMQDSTIALPSSTSRLMGFERAILEVSEIGDVLTVMLF
jgi:hypothetical protein